jgi:serine/threonine-protein kinase
MEIPPKIGKYKIIEKLGQGASGCVLKAEQEIIGRIVAIKVLFAHLLQAKPASMRRFKREARLAASLVHPNIVPIFEIGEADGMHYYTMQHIAGTPMASYIHNDTFTLKQRVELFVELCDALALAHRRNIIHRDLKPQNVIVTKDTHPVILDFGIAKSLIEQDEQVTQAGNILGSAHYMAPEQAGPGDVGTYTDVFGLGVMLYEMIARRKPFEGNSVPELIYERIQYRQNPDSHRPLSMREIDSTIPETLNTIAFHCLEALPEKRYPSANELLADLKKFDRDLQFSQGLQNRQKTYGKIKPPVNVRKSYVYPSLLALTILGAMLACGVWLYSTQAPGERLATLKALQTQGSQILTHYVKEWKKILHVGK